MSATLASVAAADAAIAAARVVSLSAYVLESGASTVAALELAAARGARVDVVLDGAPYVGGADGALARTNARTAADLAAHGVRVRLSRPPESMHLKAVVADGVAFLDDRNWTSSGGDLVARIAEPEDVARVATVVRGIAGTDADPGATVVTTKRDALALEAATIASAPGDRIDVASESFGAGPVERALAERAASGARVRLLVGAAALARDAGRESAALAHLVAAGVAIRTTADEHKLCVAGHRAWIGSANATYPVPGAPDWGAVIDEPADVASIAATFERDWLAGTSIGRS